MPVVVQGVRGGVECSTGCSVPVYSHTGSEGGSRVQHGLLCTCSRTGSEGGTRVQHGLLCACSRTGSEGGSRV